VFLVIGLGNPGLRYKQTRHNVGFAVVDALADELGVKLRKPIFRKYQIGKGECGKHSIIMVKPLTYMNHSGSVIPSLLKKYSQAYPDHFVVITDNLDLPLGTVRLKRGASTAGHKGLSSIREVIPDKPYLRLFIGIGRPKDKGEIVSYVLGRPEGREEDLFLDSIKEGAKVIQQLCNKDPDTVMNENN